MTIFYPDVSHHQTGLTIQPETPAVCAKATEGTSVTDPAYSGFKSQAAAQGAFFFAYHWLHRGNTDAQADHCRSIAGTTPVMIDCEDTSDVPTVSDCAAFANALRSRGGVCTLAYLPHWYWQDHLGSPGLQPLAAAGLSLVSSNYTTYSDTGPGWEGYGGLSPVIWQYSDSHPYGDRTVDFNAYRGTSVQLRALVTGAPAVTTTEDDMAHLDLELNAPRILTSPTVVGGAGWVCLSSDFGTGQVRVALKHKGGGWDVHDQLAVDPAADHLVVGKIDSSVTKISVLLESVTSSNTAVSLDVLPDHPL